MSITPGAFEPIPASPVLLSAFRGYFKAGQSRNPADCQRLLGISAGQYRAVVLISTSGCILLAILLVWLLSDRIPPLPNWAKVAAAFGYGAVWMGIIQPAVDVTVIRVIRHRSIPNPGATD